MPPAQAGDGVRGRSPRAEMKRVLVVLAVVAAVAIAVDVLGDMTQSRPDKVNEDAVTEVIMRVDEDRFGFGRDAAADALWSVCWAMTSSRMEGDGRLESLGDGRYRAVLRPAVGHHDERQLVGCLEDLTVDRVLADVETFRTYPVSSAA
jgi:hypothetical protein